MGPLLFNTNYIAPIWSGDRINKTRGLAGNELYGEGFDVSAHRGMVTSVKGGPYDGTPLDELIRDHHEEVIGTSDDDGVTQTLMLDARETVSVQVHPNEAYAREHEDDHEKAEAWYVFEADPGSTLIAGSLTDDVDALRAAAADDTIGDKYGRRVPVTEGDFIVVPSGTLHAYGAGIFAMEIGTLGFTTYRLCDWGRGRELHVEKGFDVLDVVPKPDPIHLGKFDPTAPARTVRGTADDDLFVIDIMDVPESWDDVTGDEYRVLTCAAGECDVTSAEGSIHLGFTESCLVPASAGAYTVTGPCRVISSRMRH